MSDRYSLILHHVSQAGHATVAELSQQVGLSEVSIRRYLQQLEDRGLLRRVRGGAEAIARPGQVSLYEARLLERPGTKAQIGRAAAGLIQPGDTVLLDSGTTVLEVVRHLPQDLLETGGLTVITRSLVIASELRTRRHVRLILLGGVYLHEFDDFVGDQVESAIEKLHVHKLFIGTDGVSAERGLTTDNIMEAGLYRSMAGIAGQVIVVTDSSKIGLDKLQAILSFDEIDTFITDEDAPADFVDLLRQHNVEVILAPTA